MPAQTDVFHMMYERDDNGSVKRRTELVEGRDEVFHMDGHHRLKEWLLEYEQGGGGSGTQASIYTYDSIDNLEKVKVSISIPGLFERREEVSGISHVFVVHTGDGPVAEIVYRASDPEPRVVHYRHHEMLGSVAVTTAKGGAASRRYHEPYGGHVAFDGSPAAAQPLRLDSRSCVA